MVGHTIMFLGIQGTHAGHQADLIRRRSFEQGQLNLAINKFVNDNVSTTTAKYR